MIGWIVAAYLLVCIVLISVVLQHESDIKPWWQSAIGVIVSPFVVAYFFFAELIERRRNR